MGKDTSDYRLDGLYFDGLEFSGFTIKYENNKVIGVDKSWGM